MPYHFQFNTLWLVLLHEAIHLFLMGLGKSF